MTLNHAMLLLGLVSATASAAYAQSETPAPGVVVRGSSDVQSGGLPVARQGDGTTTPGGGVVQGSPDVIINGKPAARLGDRTNCGVIVNGSSNVFINGRPMARVGDNTSGCQMPRRNSSIGFMGVFGRSHDLREFDRALRSVDLHPKLVPEAVKLTVCALLKDQANSDDPPAEAYRPAAEIVAYCMLGANGFAGANDADLTLAVEQRIEAALDASDSLDAQLMLLVLHARVVQPSVVDRFGLESAPDNSR